MNPAAGWPVRLSEGPVGLRPIRRRDRAAWREVRARNADWLRRWEATLPPESEIGRASSFGAMVRALNRQARAGVALPFVVTYELPGEGERLVGQLTVSGITFGSARYAAIGYWVDRAFAGRGIIPTAVALAADHSFFALGLHRIEVTIRPENAASLRVVEKLGFRSEGIRPRYLHIDGDWRDHVVYALNREEAPEGLLQRLRRSRAAAEK